MNTSAKSLYSAEEVAELLGLHVRTVRRYIREGLIEATRIGKQYRVSAAALREFVGSETPTEPSRARRVLVASTVDIDAIGREESDRLATGLTGAMKAPREDGQRVHLECIYYEEQGRLRIIINAGPSYTSSLLSMIEAILHDGRS